MIRKSSRDDAEQVARLVDVVFEPHIRRWTGNAEQEERLQLIRHFFKSEANAFSYQCTDVYENNGRVEGIVVHYPGEQDEVLFKPVMEYVKAHYPSGKTDPPDKEEPSPEYYIGLLSVSAEARGQGLGTKLIEHAEREALKTTNSTALSVREDNGQAEKLYKQLGYHYKKTHKSDELVYDYLIKNLGRPQ
ncbi:acetyltransferase [Geomicrobium sp. JCM 19037]|uniref:GNAT family N-acetyltransferase n=1 Tax=Geomicrobium sp. JCM 19037 TaxID=1460634 RepID=UPI00045F3103|nr:N-acetyltransferase [Geomicrobium sp. JCM 19037]GAK04577.1 acetyltransferase [Geomicrobium sp. JCM 19037]